MHLADYQTPTQMVRVTEVKGEGEFEADEARLSVTVTAVPTGKAEVYLGDGKVPTYYLDKGQSRELPGLFVGAFRVHGHSTVTEVLVHSAG